MSVHPRAGRPADPADLVDVPALLDAYQTIRPDPSVATQRVAFGTSGHRGSAFTASFNEAHVVAMTEAVCRYRASQGIVGPLFVGRDTHALSELESGWEAIRRVPFTDARPRATGYDFLGTYVDDLATVLDMDAIRASGLRLGVDPMGGASVAYWAAIGDRYRLDLTVTNPVVDPTFRFLTLDWDGRIRMDPSSRYPMDRLVELRDRFGLAMGNDADADRHGIVTPGAGLMDPNHFLSAAIAYLFGGARDWSPTVGVGKTLVSSSMIDRIAADLGRALLEVPVGFKWFVGGFLDGSIGFGGEESAGASFLRRDGTVWTTDMTASSPACWPLR